MYLIHTAFSTFVTFFREVKFAKFSSLKGDTIIHFFKLFLLLTLQITLLNQYLIIIINMLIKIKIMEFFLTLLYTT